VGEKVIKVAETIKKKGKAVFFYRKTNPRENISTFPGVRDMRGFTGY
jgi:hypothetical protein